MRRRDFLRLGATSLLLSSVTTAQDIYDYNPVSGTTSVVITKPSAQLPPVDFKVVQAARYPSAQQWVRVCGSPFGDLMAVIEAKYHDSLHFYNRKTKKWNKLPLNHQAVQRVTKGAGRPYQFIYLGGDRHGVYAGVSFYGDWGLSIPSVVYVGQGRDAECIIHPQFYMESAARTKSSPSIHLSNGPDGTLWSVSGQKTKQPYHGAKVDVMRLVNDGKKIKAHPVVIKFEGQTPPASSLFYGCGDWRGGYVFYTGQTLWRLDPSGTARPLVNVQVSNDGSDWDCPAVDGRGDIWIPVFSKFKSVGYSQGDGTTDVYAHSSGRSRLVRVRITKRGTQLHEISAPSLLGALGLERNGVMTTYRLAPEPKTGGIVGYDDHQQVAYHLMTNS